MSGGGTRLPGSSGASGSPGKKDRTFTSALESSRDICRLRIAPPVSIDGSRAVLARSTLLRRRPVSPSSEPVPALSESVQTRWTRNGLSPVAKHAKLAAYDTFRRCAKLTRGERSSIRAQGSPLTCHMTSACWYRPAIALISSPAMKRSLSGNLRMNARPSNVEGGKRERVTEG